MDHFNNDWLPLSVALIGVSHRACTIYNRRLERAHLTGMLPSILTSVMMAVPLMPPHVKLFDVKKVYYTSGYGTTVFFLLVFNTTNHLFLFNFTVFQKCYKRSDLGRIETKHQTFSILHFRALATKTCQLKNVFRLENVDKLYTVSSLQSTHWYFTVHFLFCDLLVIHRFLWADRGPKIWIGQPQWIYSISFSCWRTSFRSGPIYFT